jgi:hypothetical protein
VPDIEPGEPGNRRKPAPSRPGSGSRRLAEAPSARFADRADGATRTASEPSALPGPLLRAIVVAAVGAVVLVVVGTVLASTTGLLFAAGATGGATGLVLARASVPRDGGAPMTRRAVTWIAIVVVLSAVVVADLATWVVARGEGGTLGPLDYLLATFGPFVPGELLFGALGAAWGARSGPVQA